MIRRNARLRKEYLYRKSLEGKDKAAYERKLTMRKALEGTRHLCLCVGLSVPTGPQHAWRPPRMHAHAARPCHVAARHCPILHLTP